METWNQIALKAAEKVFEGGPWAALAIFLLIVWLVSNGLLVRALIREGALNREAHIGTATAMAKFSSLIEEIRRTLKP